MANNRRIELFARKLCSLYKDFHQDNFDIELFNKEIMDSFLHLAQEALYHERYSEIIEFGKAIGNDPDEEIYGFKLKNNNIFVASILNRLEKMKIPDEVLERFPDLTQEEWLASIRVATLVLAAFSPSKSINSPNPKIT